MKQNRMDARSVYKYCQKATLMYRWVFFTNSLN